jgi:hypothetical protein
MSYDKRFIKIGEAAKMLGVSPAALRLWEERGDLLPHHKTASGVRIYFYGDIVARGGVAIGALIEDQPVKTYEKRQSTCKETAPALPIVPLRLPTRAA